MDYVRPILGGSSGSAMAGVNLVVRLIDLLVHKKIITTDEADELVDTLMTDLTNANIGPGGSAASELKKVFG